MRRGQTNPEVTTRRRFLIRSGKRQKFTFQPSNPRHNPGVETLKNLVDDAVEGALKKFAALRLRPDEIAVTLVDLTGEEPFPSAHHRGDEPIYPASVVKMFYLAATHRWLEDNKISDTPELHRALHDMIVHSGNEATGYVVDA